MRARRQIAVAAEPAPIAWRDGIHVTGTPIWCDARRAREVCFVSCAHAVGRSRHGQLIATGPVLALLAHRDAGAPGPAGAGPGAAASLAVPYGRPFTLGTRTLELIPSGHGLGSASLVVDVDGRRVIYAGPLHRRGCDLGGTAAPRECDVLVVTATYGDPRFRFPDPERVKGEVRDFAVRTLGAGGVPVLLCSTASKGLDLAAHLGAELAIAADRAIHHAAQRVRPLLPGLPPIRRCASRAAVGSGRVLVWLTANRPAVDALRLPPASRIALVSGAAVDPAAVAAAGAEVGFAWASQADFDDLVAHVEESGARQVFATGWHAERFAAALDRPGRRVAALGPPRQMSLFP